MIATPWEGVPPVDEASRSAALTRQATLTKPLGALGRLEPLSAWVCAVQGACPPQMFTRPALVILAGDHGVARTAGTSAYPPEVTAQMVLNFLAGGAAANVLARMAGASVSVVDVSVDAPEAYAPTDVVRHRIRRSSGSIDTEDAMTHEEAAMALSLGDDLAASAVAEGADILIPGDMGIGNTTPATTLIAILTRSTPQATVGRGTGIDDATLTRKTEAITQAIGRGREYVDDPLALLATVGSPDIAAMTGFILGAARRRIPIVLDGIVSCAAAIVAREIDVGVVAWLTAGHRSTEPAARLALAALGLAPIVDLDLRLGEGTGALLALHSINAAALTLGEMATFDSAGVSNRDA